MSQMFVASKHGATASLLRLLVGILCMKAGATVAVILSADGAVGINTTDVSTQSQSIQPKGAHGSSNLLNAAVKASPVGVRLEHGMKPQKVGKATSLLASRALQTPPTAPPPALQAPLTTTAAPGVLKRLSGCETLIETDSNVVARKISDCGGQSPTTTAAAGTPAASTAPPPSGAALDLTVTAAPGASTSLLVAVAVTDAPWTGVGTPAPVLQVIRSIAGGGLDGAAATGGTQVPPAIDLMPALVTPTQSPIARWAQGGLLTMHGCECAESWQLNGLTLRGCVVSNDVRMPWCMVKNPATCNRGYRNAALPTESASGSNPNKQVINGTWDFCTLQEDVDPHLTLGSCHCLPLWEHGGVAYSGCNKTGDVASPGKSWCYVAEAGSSCVGARAPDATHLQKWDVCDPPEAQPEFMTKNSCHCKPRWTYKGKEYTSCVQDELVPPPADMNTTNTTIKKEMLGWCQVFEDERLCPGVEQTAQGVLWDACFFEDEATRASLPPTLHGCHCIPEWQLDGVTYSGCARTPLAKASWCPVVEDKAACSNSLEPVNAEYGAGRGKRYWDWCTVENPKDPSQPWRLSSERFVPKDPSPPAWYHQVFQNLKTGYGDWLNTRRLDQATYNSGRRRIGGFWDSF